jgi:hypothetical protein
VSVGTTQRRAHDDPMGPSACRWAVRRAHFARGTKYRPCEVQRQNAHPPGAYGASSPPKFVLGATRLRANGRGCDLGGGGGWGFAGEAVGVGLGGVGAGCEMAEGRPEHGEAGRRGAARALWEKGCEGERDPAEEPR